MFWQSPKCSGIQVVGTVISGHTGSISPKYRVERTPQHCNKICDGRQPDRSVSRLSIEVTEFYFYTFLRTGLRRTAHVSCKFLLFRFAFFSLHKCFILSLCCVFFLPSNTFWFLRLIHKNLYFMDFFPYFFLSVQSYIFIFSLFNSSSICLM